MAESRSTGPDGPVTVLVVDDDEDVRKTVAAALEGAGYEVLAAESAERGLELAERSGTPVDIALLDIMLPDSWGAQLVPGLKLVNPAVRVIYTSGYTRSDPVLRAAIDDDTPFLSKPFEIEEMLGIVRESLRQSANAD